MEIVLVDDITIRVSFRHPESLLRASMTPHSFVFLLPRTDAAASKKTVLLIEKASEKDPTLISELSSIKRAAALIRQIRSESPGKEIALDTACEVGRDLLCRSRPILKFNRKGFDPLFTLSQLFDLVRNDIPGELSDVRTKDFVEYVIKLLHTVRSNGGRRPCTANDLLLAEIGINRSRNPPIPEMESFLAGHPLCRVPFFFVEEAKLRLGHRADFDSPKLHCVIMRLATSFAQLGQSMFPEYGHNWLFAPSLQEGKLSDGNSPDAHLGMRYRVDDFIYTVLNGSTRNRKAIFRDYPVQSRIVRLTDQLLSAIQIGAIRLFAPENDRNRYDRINAFLDLTMKIWTLSLYSDCDIKPPIVDRSLLRTDIQNHFQQIVLNPFI